MARLSNRLSGTALVYAVVYAPPAEPGTTTPVLYRAATAQEASEWIEARRVADQEGVERGYYGIDGPSDQYTDWDLDQHPRFLSQSLAQITKGAKQGGMMESSVRNCPYREKCRNPLCRAWWNCAEVPSRSKEGELRDRPT